MGQSCQRSSKEIWFHHSGKHKEAISWTMTDIKGLTPAIIQHRIHLNEKAKQKRDLQHRLNPIMQEVARARNRETFR